MRRGRKKRRVFKRNIKSVLTSAKRLPGLLFSSGKLLIHDLLEFPKLLPKRLTAHVFDYLQAKFSS